MKQLFTDLPDILLRLINDHRNRRILYISSIVFLFSCLLFLLFGTVTPRSKTGSTEYPAATSIPITPTISRTKWWVKAISTSSTPSHMSESTDPTEEITSECPSSSSSALQPGIHAYISLTPPLPNRIRAGAAKASLYLGQVQPGAGVKIIDGPLCADGFSWWLVESVEGNLRGWTVEGSISEQWVIACPNVTVVCKTTPVSTQSAPTTASSSTQDNNHDKCNSDKFSIGMLAQVERDNLLVIRSEPYIGSVLGHAGPMSAVKIVDGPDCAAGTVWWEVNVATISLTGWATEANLRACSKEDGCT